MQRVLFLYNGNSGRGDMNRRKNRICEILSSRGASVTSEPIAFDRNPFDGHEDIDTVVVAGGDGTVGYVVNAIASKGLDVALGVIPAGTANDFAGALGMSNNILKAARQIAYGTPEAIDCGKVVQMGSTDAPAIYFVNIFSFGIFTTTSQHTPERLKHIMGRAAYMIEGFKELKKLQGIPLTITSDAEAFYYPTLMGLVFNGETAGRMPLARMANLRDGVFDCLFLRKRQTLFQSVCDMLLYVIGIKTKAVRYIRTSELTLFTPVSTATDVDGQSGGRFPMKVCCLRGALTIVCPLVERK